MEQPNHCPSGRPNNPCKSFELLCAEYHEPRCMADNNAKEIVFRVQGKKSDGMIHECIAMMEHHSDDLEFAHDVGKQAFQIGHIDARNNLQTNEEGYFVFVVRKTRKASTGFRRAITCIFEHRMPGNYKWCRHEEVIKLTISG